MSRLRSRPVLLGIAVVAVAVAVVVLVQRSGGEDVTAADKAFVEVCEDHGGTAELAPGSGNYVKDARDCTIEYGGESYEMYAVHPEGFSAREAEDARQACVKQAAQERRDPENGSTPATFTWHPKSGICEKSTDE
jgi:hypothetical protein